MDTFIQDVSQVLRFEDLTDESLEARMRRQTEQALADADVVLFVIDAREGVTQLDEVFAARGETLLQFADGLIGYPALKAYRLFEPKDGYPLKFLQSVEREDISFTCIDVGAIKPDYVVPLNDADAQELAIEAPADALILALVMIPEDATRMTANLAGPVVVNVKTLKARQIVLNIDHFPLAYPVFSGK